MRRGGSTPLLFAARSGDVESATLLLAAGANVNDALPTATPRWSLAAHSGHGSVASLLLDKGADPNAAARLHRASCGGAARATSNLVKALLAHGADPNAQIPKGTPVRRRSQDFDLRRRSWRHAVLAGGEVPRAGIMRALAAAGADPLLSTKDRRPPR